MVLALTLLVMLASAGFCAVYLVREYTKVYSITNTGDMWSFVRMDEESTFPPFLEIDPDDFPHPPYPQRGDLLVAVDGRPATRENYMRTFSMDTPPGQTIGIMFRHGGELYATDIVTRSIPGPLKLQIWTMFLLRTLIAMGLVLTGAWGLVRRSASAAVRTLSLFCVTLAVHMALDSTIVAHLYASFQLPSMMITLFTVVGLSSSAFWLKLHLLFPQVNPIYRNNRFLSNILIFLPVIIGGLYALLRRSLPDMLTVSVYRTIYLSGGFILLIRNMAGAESFIERRQTRLVLLGSFPGIALFILYGWFIYTVNHMQLQLPIQTHMLIVNIVFLFLLPIPISIIYAFRKYRLLEVEGRLRRGTRFLAVNLLLVLVFFGLFYLFGEFLLNEVGISSRTPTLVLGLILALAFMPTQRKLRSMVEDYFYPEKRRLRELLRDFLASSMVRAEGSSFWNSLQKKLAEGLAAERIYPLLRAEDTGRFILQDNEPSPFSDADPLVERLLSREVPILLDEAVESGRVALTGEQLRWFEERNCAVILPLTAGSGLVGFLAISSKTNGEDFSTGELELLNSFSAQIALVAENIQLLQEKIEKQKLQEQLSVARKIQQGLLPGEIPRIPGLEIRTLIRFCLDVAGDYYDVMPLKDGRVTIAVADVAGKGVGPALLMANLQASLRTMRDMGISLAESAARMNSLIYDNTPSELFITFFMACVDPRDGRVCYVNAGHDPPLLVRSSGESERLTEGGLLFGVARQARYTEGLVSFNPGDTILMYTDGVSEAMNSRGEEFGDHRIEALVRKNLNIGPERLLETIDSSVARFHGSSSYSDDFTLLAVRRNTAGDGS